MENKVTEMSVDVLISGGGPVGMLLALDLASRGVEVCIAEKASRETRQFPRANHISARTLEILRRLGLADEIRNAGLPAWYPHDISYVSSLTGREFTRIRIPSRENRFGSSGYADSGWPTPEPPHRCNQMFFEPIIYSHLKKTPRIRVLDCTEIDSFEQEASGVIARAHSDRERLSIRAKYLVGCDGGRSSVRKAIGASFEGRAVVMRNRSLLVRAPGFTDPMKIPPAWLTFFRNDGINGLVVALNGTDLWMYNIWVPDDAPDFDVIDPMKAVRAGLGQDIECEILQVYDWYGRRLVADRFRDRRVFITGDAAHLWIPFAGYGMNAGIADAMNLSWQLAAVVNGWGAPGLLDAYEAERKPVTEQISTYAMNLALKNAELLAKTPLPHLEDKGPKGDEERARLGQSLYDANIGQWACIGLNFGTFYDHSPIVAYDEEKAPEYTLSTYKPSTVPGCRTPHIWLKDDSSLYDQLGLDYTLLRFDASVDVTPLVNAAKQRRLPLKVLDISRAEAAGVYHEKLILVRPDQYNAWRGDAVPNDPFVLIDLVRGAAAGSH